jgi:hypothetical protein
MYVMKDPFSEKKSLLRYSDIAGLAVAFGAFTLAAVIAWTGGGSRKKPIPNVLTQGQQLVANVKHGQSIRNRHFQGILAIYNNRGDDPSLVVVNPYVAPIRDGVTPQINSPQTQDDYNYFALIASKDPTTGKITFKPDEVLVGGVPSTMTDSSILGAESLHSSTPIQQTSVSAVSATSVGNPNHYVFSPSDASSVKLLGHYTYSVVGNEVLVPTGGANSATGGHEPEGLLLSAHPAQ